VPRRKGGRRAVCSTKEKRGNTQGVIKAQAKQKKNNKTGPALPKRGGSRGTTKGEGSRHSSDER